LSKLAAQLLEVTGRRKVRYRRVVVRHRGGPEVLQVVEEDLPQPRPGDGKIRFSPIVSGWSGIEGNLINGAAYLFLLDIRKDGSDANVSVLRVEPLAKRDLVIATWRAGAAPDFRLGLP
jgi:hypothetical protein